jgi:hypothetical protein
MITFKNFGRVAAGLLLCGSLSIGVVSGALAQAKPATPQGNGEFDGSTFTCLNYTNGLGENASNKTQSMLARVWIEGYLAGYFKAQNKLELSNEKADGDKVVNLMLQKCREYPSSSILAVSQQAIAKESIKIPGTALADFSPANYTCADHTEAKKGGASGANRADIADLWAIAFIQGYKNVAQSDMVIPMENKSVLTGAIARNCEKNATMKFLDLTALVADKVKLQ